MKIELENKLESSKKVWISDEEKLDINTCLNSVKKIFMGMEPSDLLELVEGLIVYEDENNNEISQDKYEFYNCFPIFESFDSWKDGKGVDDKKYHEKFLKVQF